MIQSHPGRVLLVLDPARLWRWQAWVASDIAAGGGAKVSLRFAQSSRGLPVPVTLLMRLERLLFGDVGERASDILSADEFKRAASAGEDTGANPFDLVVDFTDGTAQPDATCTLRPLFDGQPGYRAAIGALLAHRLPRLGIGDSAINGAQHLGTCAVEQPNVLTRGLDTVFSRMAGLLVDAVRRPRSATATPRTASPEGLGAVAPEMAAMAESGVFLASMLADRARARLARLLKSAPTWSVGWRRSDGNAACETLDLSAGGFRRLADDGQRFFADPFTIRRDGIHFVFCEEFPYATRKGVISVFTVSRDGTVSPPRTVLERPYHLSYPFVFERDGEVWMIPESSANRTVELYRAERFPHRWTREAVLLEDRLADDATLVEHGGRFWMFAAIRDRQASSWDALGLFHAPELLGPWSEHDANPVLLDPTAARPGGAMFTHEGKLYRPAQDCSAGYGSGLTLCSVDRLDEESYGQTEIGALRPRGRGGLHGIHTLNHAHGLEVIDRLASF